MMNVKISSALIERVHGYNCLWNVSADAYHKKDVRQAALRSVYLSLQETHEKETLEIFGLP